MSHNDLEIVPCSRITALLLRSLNFVCLRSEWYSNMVSLASPCAVKFKIQLYAFVRLCVFVESSRFFMRFRGEFGTSDTPWSLYLESIVNLTRGFERADSIRGEFFNKIIFRRHDFSLPKFKFLIVCYRNC